MIEPYPSWVAAFPFDHPLTTRVFLLGGDVCATFVVAWGILWEAASQPIWRHRIAMWLVIWGVAAETLCSICLFAFDESISRSQQARIELQRKEIIALEKEGNAAAEKNAALETIMLPRRFPVARYPTLMGAIRQSCPALEKFAGTNAIFQLVPEQEPIRWAGDLYAMLYMLHWRPQWPKGNDSALSGVRAMYISEGVSVFVPSSERHADGRGPNASRPDTKRLTIAGKALVECLEAAFGMGSARFSGPLAPPNMKIGEPGQFPNFDPQPDAIIIFVGNSPIAERIALLDKGIAH